MASSNNLFELEQIVVENTGVDATHIFEEIHKEMGDYLTGQGHNADSMDSVFDFLENLTSSLHEDFDELIGEDTDEKRFVKALTRIFTLLLNAKVDTADKIKGILRIAIEMTLKICKDQSNTPSKGMSAPVLALTSKKKASEDQTNLPLQD